MFNFYFAYNFFLFIQFWCDSSQRQPTASNKIILASAQSKALARTVIPTETIS